MVYKKEVLLILFSFIVIVSTFFVQAADCSENLSYYLNPYAVSWNETTEIIAFEVNSSGVNVTLSYGLTPAYDLSFSNSSFSTRHEITLTGLNPNARYYYQLTIINGSDEGCIKNTTFNSSFISSANNKTSFRFAIFSDSQGTGCGNVNYPVFSNLLTNASKKNIDFVVMLGDDIETSGCSSAAEFSNGWKNFNNVTYRYIQNQSIISVVGNHDGISTDTGYAAWRNYWMAPSNGVGNPDRSNETIFTWNYGNSLFIFLSTQDNITGADNNMGDEEINWFNNTALGISGYTHKFVLSHRTLVGSNQDGMYWYNSVKSASLDQRMYDNGVTAEFAGHDHYFCYNSTQEGKMPHFIAGGAGGGLLGCGYCLGSCVSQNHYLIVEVNGSKMNVTAYNLADSIIYSYVRDMDIYSPAINFSSPSDSSGSSVGRNYIIVNVSANDSYFSNLANITINLYNSTELINSSFSLNSTLYSTFSINYYGIFFFNATACDSSGNCNSTETRNVTTINFSIAQVLIINQSEISGGNISKGDNITINATIVGAQAVWVNIWQNITGGSILLTRYLSNVENSYTTTFTTNLSFNIGQVNYTVYANDSSNTIINSSGNFTLVQGARVYDCGTLGTVNTTYILQNNISGRVGTCFSVTGNNTILDGNGFIIEGDSSGGDYGVYAVKLNNFSVKNFRNISFFDEGVYFETTINSSIINNSLSYNAVSNSYGIHLYAGGNNNVTNNQIVTRTGRGIQLEFSNNNFIINNSVLNASRGIRLDSSSSNILFNNYVDNNYTGGTEGIYIRDSSSYNQIINNTVTRTSAGVYLRGSSVGIVITGNILYKNTAGITPSDTTNSNITITGNNISSNTNQGIYLRASNNLVSDNIINNNSYGINLNAASTTRLFNNSVNGNVQGIRIEGSSNNNNITNNTLIGNVIDFYSLASSSTTFINNWFNNSLTNFRYSGTIRVSSIPAPTTDPTGYFNMGRYLNITNETNSWIALNISYADSDILTFNETNFTLLDYNYTDWSQMSNVTLNSVENYLYVNISKLNKYNIIAPMKLFIDYPPVTNLVSPANESITSSKTVAFSCNATDDVNLANITLYWNYSGTWQANETIAITGLINQTIFSKTNLNNGIILWTCLICDNVSQCSFASLNYTVNVNYTSPNITEVIALNRSGISGGIVERGDNVTLNATIIANSTAITSVWVTIWQNIIEGPILAIQYLQNILGNLWTTTFATNSSFHIGQVNYTVYANDSSNTIVNSSGNFSVQDTIFPVLSIVYPGALNYSVNVSALNYSISELSPDSCWYSNNSGIWNSTSVLAGNNFTNVVSIEGNNNWTIYCNDSAGNLNSSFITFFKDSVYPIFSTYQNDSVSFTSSELVFFNITLLNTNGSVWLEINNVNISATNLTSNVYNVSYNFTISGTYNYTWWSYSNRTNNNLNNSGTKSYITASFSSSADEVVSISSQSSASGGCLTKWNCSTWGDCSLNGSHTRSCIKTPNYCYAGKKPIEIENCTPVQAQLPDTSFNESTQTSFFKRLINSLATLSGLSPKNISNILIATISLVIIFVVYLAIRKIKKHHYPVY